ncbi:MAG: Asp-tRNA(Asn)/Glu-tRNA(Gln) amidotransferase subunit GatC [Proteobacteria bacterium]|jgi:aspartyl-tRNA(Asn)/glutamyl-tRNA(Gln) amidotransferase subunit C|nr:Asp-tRNA(Asn)/Glu-tRNA(Gln) amidotransferase subunit GatC [Pseudomonadota bacterium]MBK7115993.1 Asp-tRNA(Asn)/Glu-tRNA(Gln) amidotransferase subunit GatC [Pseudomonadota bacterium]
MSLTSKEIETVAGLARLQLTPDEIPVYAQSLSRILGMVGQLDKAETGLVEPMAHPLAGQVQRLREDAISSRDERDLYQRNAPQVEAGLYLVPKVIE